MNVKWTDIVFRCVMEMKLSLTQNENNIRPFYIIGLFYFVKTIANTFLMC